MSALDDILGRSTTFHGGPEPYKPLWAQDRMDEAAQASAPPPPMAAPGEATGAEDPYADARKAMIAEILQLAKDQPESSRPSRIKWTEAIGMAFNPDMIPYVLQKHRAAPDRRAGKISMLHDVLGVLPKPVPRKAMDYEAVPGEAGYYRQPGQTTAFRLGGLPEPEPKAAPQPHGWGGTKGRYMWDPEQGKVVETPGMPEPAPGEEEGVPEHIWGRFLDEGVNPVPPGHPLHETLGVVAAARSAGKGRKYSEKVNAEIRHIWAQAYNANPYAKPEDREKQADEAVLAFSQRYQKEQPPPGSGAGGPPAPPAGAGQAGTATQADPAPFIPVAGGGMTFDQAMAELQKRGIPEQQAFEILFQKGY